jgi:DnaJ-class molecular chaperone
MFDFDPQKDYYKMLGLEESASDEEIKKAFRKAAMKHHPDKWGDQEEFKKINEAYQVIGDTQKRQQYDSVRKGWFGWFGWGGFGGGGFGGFQWADVQFEWFGDLGDIIEQFMWGGFGWASRRPRKGQDIQLSLTITFEESYHGVTKSVNYAKHEFDTNGQATRVTKKVDVKAPAGIQHGQYIKYTWMGDGWRNWGPDGDLFVQINVQSNSLWTRKWDDIYTSIEIAVHDLVLGAEYEVAHPDGNVIVKIPKYTQPTDILRVKGKWFGKGWMFSHSGDLMVKLIIKTPKKLSKEETKLWEKIREEAK